MNLSRVLSTMALSSVLMGPTQASPAAQQAPASFGPAPIDWHPNVLVILCDQLNARMLGHEQNGWGGLTQSMTPNLDQLASQGVRFANASCSSASCQPSRYSILTGRWPFHHGVRVNQTWEPRTETTFPELAQAAGYRTANIGLHHLMWDNQRIGWGDAHGYDEILDFGDYASFCSDNGQPSYTAPGNYWAMPGLPIFAAFERTGYTFNKNEFHPTGYFAQEVIRFLRERAGPQGDGEPFVCWYSMRSPHPPMLPSGVGGDDWAHLYHPFDQLRLPPNFEKFATTQRLDFIQQQFSGLTENQMREALSYYYGLISQADFNIGRVLDELDALGIADDTLVIFTSDHGEMASEMRCFTKGTGSYDALTRAPLLMRLPGILPAGRTISEPVTNIDIFPTLVETTGVPISDEVRGKVDGVSLLDLMIQPAPPSAWRQETYHVLGTVVDGSLTRYSVRTPTAKYCFDDLDRSEEFYDLANDPSEMHDLFTLSDTQVQAQIADLKSRFAAWWNNAAGHAPQYTVIGAWDAIPARPIDPVPANLATGVPRDIDPGWLTSTGAAVQEVYLGLNPLNMLLFTTLGHMESSFNPGTLQAGTTYYWSVREINGNGSNQSPVWRFDTSSSGPGGPGLASVPSPAQRASGLGIHSQLSWTLANGTQGQDIYFGRSGQLALVAGGIPATATTWDPGNLSAGVSYEWRIDTIDGNGTTEGVLWHFDTSPAGLPDRATSISPGHFENILPGLLGTRLRWSPGVGASSHDIYFGSSFPLTLSAQQNSTTLDVGPLASGQTYYWRVDEVNASGTRTGWTWRFRR